MIIAQTIGIVAMGFNILSFQFKRKQTLLLFQLVGASLFAVNMFMLDATMGGILNVLAVVRALVYLKVEKLNISIHVINSLFVFLYLASYVLVFTLFQKEPSLRNFVLEFFPIIGMTLMTFSFAGKSSKIIRVTNFINSPCWLIYNIFNFAIGGILCEVFCLASAISAFIRLDIKKSKKTQN